MREKEKDLKTLHLQLTPKEAARVRETIMYLRQITKTTFYRYLDNPESIKKLQHPIWMAAYRVKYIIPNLQKT